ncbi:MAG: hypothetical protein QOE70_3719 [Chthoniobacter sp.]|jgi:hypothetical protein|nr:hypothetical protein [Chthoniobacter sp.]
MNLADVFTFLFVILGFLIVFVGYWLMAVGLWPGRVERCAEQLGRAPVRTTLVGLVSFVPLVVIGLSMGTKAPNGFLKVVGLGLALGTLFVALFGSAGLALRIGCGLKSVRDEQEPWRRVLRGGIVLGLTFVLPFLGTPVLMALAFCGGFGALVWTLFAKPSPQSQLAPAPAGGPVAAMNAPAPPPPLPVTVP